MSTLLPFLIVGITSGSVYALAGVGLVLTFKTSGIFNFGHGAFATLAAFIFYALHFEHGVAWPIAALISGGVLGVALGLGLETMARGLSRVAVAWRIAATVGILLSIEAFAAIVWGTNSRTFPSFLPTSGFKLDGVEVTYEQVIIVGVSMLGTAGLYAAFRLTRVGIAMRAVVEAPDLLAMTGTSPPFVRRWAWIIGCCFATLSGLLLASSVTLDPFTLTLLIVQAFGAAAIGRFSSLPITWVGGVLVGVAESLATKYGSNHQIVRGIAPSLPFIVLFLVLMMSPKSRLRTQETVLAVKGAAWRAPDRVQVVVGVVVLAVLATVPEWVGYRLSSYTLLLTDVLLFISLGLLVRVAGQVSLCQLTFAAIGAVGFSKLAFSAHVPWLLALLVGCLIAVPIGALLAIPAIRFSGLYLALATLGFGLLVEDMFYSSSLMFGIGGAAINMPRPSLSWLNLSSDKGFYYVVLVITAVSAVGMVLLTRSRLGRLLRGVADSPTALSSSGNNVMVPLVLVFCISAYIAALAGALQGMVYTEVSGTNYDPIQSLLFLAVVLITIGTEPWYALIAGSALAIIPIYVTSSLVTYYLQLGFGVVAIAMALGGAPHERMKAVAGIRRWFDRLARPSPAVRLATGIAPSDEASVTRADGAGSRGPKLADLCLEANEVVVRFGGLTAVKNMSLTVTPGRVTGLIGPNGAGKTTLLNACSGLVSPSSGTVVLGGLDVSRANVARRAQQGLGRSFQQMELCDSLSVWDNVALGCEGAMAGSNPYRQIVARSGDREEMDQRVTWAIEQCGLGPIADRQVGGISSSDRRFVEIARCLAGPFRLLLLDEPSSGLDRHATERLGQILRSVVDGEGLGVLLVEHDMSLVMNICDDIFVMEFGELLLHGDPRTVQSSDVVRAAYLGVERVVSAGSAEGVSGGRALS